MGKHCTEHIKKGMHYVFPTVTTVRGLSAQGWGRTSRIKVPESSQLLKPALSHDIAVSLIRNNVTYVFVYR